LWWERGIYCTAGDGHFFYQFFDPYSGSGDSVWRSSARAFDWDLCRNRWRDDLRAFIDWGQLKTQLDKEVRSGVLWLPHVGGGVIIKPTLDPYFINDLTPWYAARYVIVPLWPLLLPPLTWWAAVLWLRRRKRRRARLGLCARCGYDLRGSSGAASCPECGTPIPDLSGLRRLSPAPHPQ
jgi:hypothetical protein